MNTKAAISARETIVIDENELSELGDCSLTSVMRQLSSTADKQQTGHDDDWSEAPRKSFPSQPSDSTINELLGGLASTDDLTNKPSNDSFADYSSESVLSDTAVDELLSADLLFPNGVDE